ncbi:aldehyde reductase 2 [Leucosporidium creatinivorum]|uniref:Aldehyde reductase 2 n=1 Tax=Leucosporidium creatinivorum TaxID=106004 RepID=A0A1Y2D3Y1_9BASI|nr:aldehyde reductase 2 [Leucosporidium creatinivorum]
MSPSVLPAGSTVLVTGANGLVASHTIEQILKAGYKVRGTARSAEKLAGLKKRWDSEYGVDKFEIAVVEDLLADGALDEALKGVSGVAHIASVVNFGIKREDVVIPTVNMTLNVLKSAAKFPEVKRVVLTSSSAAALIAQPGVPGITADETTWNETAVALSKALPEEFDHTTKAFIVYSASKAEGERAAWDFMAENKASGPSFEFNAVLPNLVMGKILDEESQHGSTSGWIRDYFLGKNEFVKALPAQYYVNAEDTGLIHLGALTLPDVAGQRLWAAAAPYNLDDMLAAFRKLYPSRTFPDDVQSSRDLSVIDHSKGEAVLKALGRQGWQSLEASIEQLVGRE